MYENDHFNQTQAEFKKEANGKSKQAQAEFKKEANGKSKPVAQKKKKEKKEGVYHALREWLGTHTPKDGPFASQHFPSFTIKCTTFQALLLVLGNR